MSNFDFCGIAQVKLGLIQSSQKCLISEDMQKFPENQLICFNKQKIISIESSVALIIQNKSFGKTTYTYLLGSMTQSSLP